MFIILTNIVIFTKKSKHEPQKARICQFLAKEVHKNGGHSIVVEY